MVLYLLKKDGVEGKYIVEQQWKILRCYKISSFGVQDSVTVELRHVWKDAVGHRVVHSGEKFASSVVITEKLKKL